MIPSGGGVSAFQVTRNLEKSQRISTYFSDRGTTKAYGAFEIRNYKKKSHGALRTADASVDRQLSSEAWMLE